MQKNDKKDDLVEYRMGKLTLLQLMGLLAVAGVVLTWVVYVLLNSLHLL
jgi:hypothetical protein